MTNVAGNAALNVAAGTTNTVIEGGEFTLEGALKDATTGAITGGFGVGLSEVASGGSPVVTAAAKRAGDTLTNIFENTVTGLAGQGIDSVVEEIVDPPCDNLERDCR